jgi:hypothetical protein
LVFTAVKFRVTTVAAINIISPESFMARLEEYKGFDEKCEFFTSDEGMLCGQIDLLFSKLEALNSSGKFLFRGVNSAKYKLYTSAQREFLRRELFGMDKFDSPQEKFNEWMNNLLYVIKNWNKNSIQNYFGSIGITKDDDISYLSFLQHSGFPTPLLDFTFDPFIALFFAIEGARYNSKDISLDSCISLYYFDKTTPLRKVLNADFKSEQNRNLKKYKDFIQRNVISIIDHDSVNYRVVTNLNIVNQKGCYVFNWHGVDPLEKAYPKLINKLNTSILKDMNVEPQEIKLNCLNIHKGLIPIIRHELLLRKGIDSKYIFPDFNLEKESIIDQSIINLLK